MQFGPHQDPHEVAEEVLLFVREAPVDEVMQFFFAEEQNDGHETLDRLQQWIDKSRPCREALKKAGVAVSLNPWHSMLHCDRGRRLKPGQDWQRMVDPNGRQARAVVCFLDPAWRAYFLQTLHLYAREGFRVVWIDDDIRYHNHGPLHWGGCFCPLHVAQFNSRAGITASREDIVKACLAPGAPHPWRAVWMDTWQETILQFLHECRQVLEAGGTKMGLMSSAMESHGAEGRRWEDWWKAFGNGQPPIHRPHFWTYSDTIGPHIVHGIAALDQNRSIHPADLESGPEIEGFPYGQWNKSFRQTFAQMAVAHILGSTNLNISLHDFMGNRPDDEPERAAFLKRVRPNLDWLADKFPMTLKSVGVGVPWSQDMGRTIHTTEGKSWFEFQCPSRGWSYWLGAAGIAFSARLQKDVNALAGPIAWSFDDATLKQWLSGGLLLDGVAAAILVERGLGKWIGAQSTRFVTQEDVLYSIEECRDPRFAVQVGSQISVNEKSHTRRLLQAELASGAVAVSDLHNPLQQVVGHGAFVFENDLGGRVAVVPWDASVDSVPMMDIHRATQLRRVVAWLADDNHVGWVDGGAWLVPQLLTDGATWRGVVWNASPDEISTFRFHRPRGMPPVREAWHLTPTGKRHAADVDGDVMRLGAPMHQWELVVALV
jgi:hypothetical protein